LTRRPEVGLPSDSGAGRDWLERAGYRGAAVHLETTLGMIASDTSMAEVITEMWEDVGVTVVLNPDQPRAAALLLQDAPQESGIRLGHAAE
jgi:ABC-type transport system substrate-binding protein